MRYLNLILVVVSVLGMRRVDADRGFNIGCYELQSTDRKTENRVRTVDDCIELCAKDFFEIAVISDPYCSCTEVIKSREVNESFCNLKCVGDQTQVCGGQTAQSYYQTGVNIPPPIINIQQTEITPTSITLTWIQPEQKKFLKEYIVRAKPLKTYARSLLPNQWTVPKDNTRISLSPLHPGTSYQIDIISNSDSEEGGLASVTVMTEIGIPEPEPQQPTILSRDGTSIVIEIKPQTNINGPISFYHVIVLFVDSGLIQPFNENLLTNFKQAQEDGTSYYIAAELEYQESARIFTVGDGRNYRGYQNIPLPPNSHVHISIGVISRTGNVTKARYASTSHEQHDVMIKVKVGEGTGETDFLVVTLVIACIIFGLLLVCSIIAYFYLRIRLNRRLQRLPSDHHELTLQGPIIEVENNAYIPDDYLKGNFEQKLNELLDKLPDAQKFPRNVLSLDVNNVLGSGHYGDVIVGHLNRKRCEVHVVSDDMEPLDQIQFLKDFAQIQKVSSHQNVLSFLGICQTPDWLYLMFEDAAITLKKRLVEARVPPNFDAYRFSSLSEEFILRLMAELSDAMDYLTMHQFIHKRLCSYNIRMTDHDEIKISAFGATPFDDHHKSIDLTRWCAPEVLRFQHHSVKSDIWSFACLMWECCTLGGTLYANISSGDLVSRVINGAKPEHSLFMFDDIYQLMLNCWQLEPSERPTFEDISHHLRQLLTSPKHTLSFDRRDGVLLPYYLPLLEQEYS